MARLIDADMLYNDIVQNCDNLVDAEAFKAHYLDEQPTIEAEPVRHGKWLKTAVPDVYQCSHCKKPVKMDEFCNSRNLRYFCPDCGARMDLED